MNNLAFHITDIASNSIRAEADTISLHITEQPDTITIRIGDNGCGMDAETVNRVTNPFYTTRTTRRVGLGLPFLIQNAEQTGGGVTIVSEPGNGTVVTARFMANNIDCPPWGDLSGTIAMLITGNPSVNICFRYESGEKLFSVSTEEVKESLEGIPISQPKITLLLQEIIKDQI